MHGYRLVVTGGGTGIGRAIALAAAARGARVVVAGRRREVLERLSSKVITPVVADVAVDGSVAALFDTAEEVLGGLDGVVNAAGVHDLTPSLELPTERFAEVVDINLTGAFRVSRAAGQRLRGSGSLVHIASLTSFGGFPGRLAYGVAKAGLLQLTRTLAAEWGPLGIRVNAIAPGFVRTPIADRLEAAGVLDVAAIESRTPLRRRALPEDLVGPALFLLGPDASFITGECLVADGGWLSMTGPVDRYADPRSVP